MPAAAARQKGQGLVAYLNSQAPTIPVSQTMNLQRYYHSADLLLGQAAAYRAANNEEQLYVMLIRLAGLVVETIPGHRNCIKDSRQYQQYRERALTALSEAERLKVALNLRDIRDPKARTIRRPATSVQVTDADAIPDIDWVGASAPPAAAAAAAAAGSIAAGSTAAGSLDLGLDLEWPPRTTSSSAGPAGPAAAAASAGAAAAAAATNGTDASFEPVSYSSSYAPSSQQMVQKHALFGPKSSSSQQRSLQHQGSSGNSRMRYPSVDSSPIDALWASSSGSNSQQGIPDVASLSISSHDQQLQQQQQQEGFLDAALHPSPSAGPSLGPQEIEVQSMLPCAGQPGGTCSMPPPPPGALQQQQQHQQQLVPLQPVSAPAVAEAAAAAAAGPKGLSKRIDLRDVHISVALMNDFLHYAANNTRRGIESCGILAGRLSASDSRFTVTTLIVPKQTGTSDTVEMLGEEEVWEVESSRELIPMGWIHTHPTQTCFLSSVDIHTQCGYQTMLDEAVAIVMAPTDSRKKCGIFRLTTPGGLEHVQKCTYKGFHAGCNSEHYELCGHVYLNPGAKHEVIDLR